MEISTEELWKWMDRELYDDFFKTAGKLDSKEQRRRWGEIPEKIKPLAYALIMVAVLKNEQASVAEKTASVLKTGPASATEKFEDEQSCFTYRMMVFALVKEMEKKGIKLPLPHYWYMDGVMIEPEWIVRITNGIIGWKCDASCRECGLFKDAKCRFAGDWDNATKGKVCLCERESGWNTVIESLCPKHGSGT